MNSPGQANVSILLSFAVLLLKVGLLFCLLYFVVFKLDGLAKVYPSTSNSETSKACYKEQELKV